MRALLLIITCCLLLTSAASAQQPAATPDSRQASAQSPSAPVPVPEPSEKALSYYRSGIVLWVVNVVWGLLIPALFLLTGFSARIRDWANRIGRRRFFANRVYIAIFLIINFAIDFPLSYYQGFAREHAYDLSNQTFGKWFGDEIIGLLIVIVVG
ncbi:MAG TPA: M48 family peptidase, partial [Blastocatellia bacterium]|nr:M48 family peptidase [Blastocatellia bacterium]